MKPGENGLTTTTLRDAAQRVFSHSTAAGSTVKSSVAHGYDAAGRRTYASYEDALGQAYAYDNAGQVKNVIVNTANPATVNPTASPTHAYNYDPAGNRTSSLDAGITTNYATNSVNAYTNINNNSISHDPNGNMVNDVNTSYAYDRENRLRTITQNTTVTGYTYDPLGRLIQTFNTAATDNRERYTWSGWTLLNRELFTNTTPTSSFRYTWGLDLSETLEGAGGVGGLLAIERNEPNSTTWDIRFPHYDANGNIIALTDSTGNVSARYRYDAFGKALSTEDSDYSGWAVHNIHGFSTKPTLGTPNLLYYGYRFYDPATGRWPSRDPIEERGGLNLYGFVGNTPNIRADKLGLREVGLDESFEWDFLFSSYEIIFKWSCKANVNYCCNPGNSEQITAEGNGEESVYYYYKDTESPELIRPFLLLGDQSKEKKANYNAYATAYNEAVRNLKIIITSLKLRSCAIDRKRPIECEGRRLEVGILPNSYEAIWEHFPHQEVPNDPDAVIFSY